jgi:lipopolysaccharide biosynthesis protein
LAGQRVAVFVSHAPKPEIRPHVRFHIEALCVSGIRTVLVLNSNTPMGGPTTRLDAAEGILLRANLGYDFGAWADAFRLIPDLWSAESLLLVNDSIYGPVSDLGALLSRVEAAPSDIVGLTESQEFARHLQSYFVFFKKAALSNGELRKLWLSIRPLTPKWEVVRNYEVEMRARYLKCGLTCEVIFGDPAGAKPANPTHHRWRELVDAGFPYLKGDLLRKMWDVRVDTWREVVADPRLRAIIEADQKAYLSRTASGAVAG